MDDQSAYTSAECVVMVGAMKRYLAHLIKIRNAQPEEKESLIFDLEDEKYLYERDIPREIRNRFDLRYLEKAVSE